MKITRYLLLSAIVLSFAACDPTGNEPEKPDIPEVPTDASVTATASLGQIQGSTLVWGKGDSFTVGYNGGSVVYNLTKGEGASEGEFSCKLPATSISSPFAIYPSSIIKGTGNSVNEYSFEWPTVQKTGTLTASAVPMWSSGADLDPDGNIKFKTMGGALHVNATGSGKITQISIISEKPMSGQFTVDILGNIEFVKGSKSVYYNVDIDCGAGIDMNDNGVDFYFSIPAGTYPGAKIVFESTEGCLWTTKLSEPLEISRGQMSELSVTGVKGYGAGKLLNVEAENDVNLNDIKEKLFTLAPQLKDVSALDLLLLLYVSSSTHTARITYLTPDPSGKLVQASGVVAYPNNRKYDRIVSIQHGTCDISPAPSYQTITPELMPVCIGAQDGKGSRKDFIAVMADYLGYGASQTPDLQHPYLHRELTGTCCADMLSAAEEFISLKGLELENDKIDLIGYSQGGAATLSLLLELEKRGGYDDRINAVHAGAGPYDIVGFFDFFKNRESYDKTGFVPFAFRGICYGEGIHPDYSSIYHPDLVGRVDLEELFSTTQMNSWHSVLGHDIKKIIHPDFYKEDYGGNEEIWTLVNALAKNSLIYCDTPRNVGKVTLYHSQTDDTVPPASSAILQKNWGCSDVVDLKIQNNHMMAGIEFMLRYCGMDQILDLL